MSRIRQLDPVVVNKIAAGEVVERPASVVKELLENSLDALATRITVDIQAGGAELIRITDDGEGIHPDDLLLAVTSHATSKITTDEDLFRVASMGFRGEALASIASVSQFRLRSRRAESETGWELNVNGGTISPPVECGCPVGTSVEVRQLFGNTPVRRKFLKTQGTEFGHLSEQFTRIALANPRLHLVLRHNGKNVYELPATHQLLDRLHLFYGKKLAESLIPVESQVGDVKMWGYVAHPSQTKSGRQGQYLFLNGRWIQDRSLQHALTEAYRGLVMVGRHPISFLFLEMPAGMVDVNVHPTKSEVRFRDSQSLYRQLLSMLRSKFLTSNLDGEVKLENSAAPGDPHDPVVELQQEFQQELVDWAQEETAGWENKNSSTGGSNSGMSGGYSEQKSSAPIPSFKPYPDGGRLPYPALPAQPFAVATPSEAEAPANPVREILEPRPQSRVLQVMDCYLVLETSAGLMIIDQHALHERILYEQFRERILHGSVEAQRMLVPETIELSAREAGLLLDHAELLGELGYGIEEFGRGTLLLNAYPALLKKANHVQLIRDIAERLDQPGAQPSRKEVLNSLLQMMACKAAIKSGDRLAPEEIDSLLALRHLVEDSHHCPHGRPTALVLNRNDLDKQFGRLGH